MDKNIHIGLRVLILIATICLIYFAIEDEYRQNIPLTLIVLIVLISSERFISASGCVEGMKNPDASDTIENFDRTDRLEWLNANRGELGQFYVSCRGCGRKKILQERVKSLYSTPPCGRYQSVGPCEGSSSGCSGCNGAKGRCDKCAFKETQKVIYEDGCSSCNSANNDQDSHRSYCIKDCADNIGRDTVSLWNDGYIDIDQEFCYNCLLDLKSKVLREARTYRELPPVNGPPGYSVYRDRGY